MKKYWLLLVLGWLFLSPCGLYADVVLTDEQAQELDQVYDSLEETLKKQEKKISDLQTRNSELENQLRKQEQLADERLNLLNQQGKTIKQAKSSSTRLGIFSILRSILISIVTGVIGLAFGILAF